MAGLGRLAKAVEAAISAVPAPPRGRRPSTKMICAQLTSHLRPVLEGQFGGPVYRRYSGCPEEPARSYSKTPGKVFRVLEYLWDFSLSRYAIPQAIGDPRAEPMAQGQFELLLVGESELGTQTEICRDLLKLLEARTRVRCLVHREPARPRDQRRLEARIIQTMQNHVHSAESGDAWLFAGIGWNERKVSCSIRTLSRERDRLVPIEAAEHGGEGDGPCAGAGGLDPGFAAHG